MARAWRATSRRAWDVLLTLLRRGASPPLPATWKRARRPLAFFVLGVASLAAGAVPLVSIFFGLAAAALAKSFAAPSAPDSTGRRIGPVAVGGFAFAGAVLGLVLPAVLDALSSRSLHPLWYGLGLLGGITVVPLSLWAFARRQWVAPRVLRRAGVHMPWVLLSLIPIIAIPCTAYVVTWIRLPQATARFAVWYALVGVAVWPLATASLRHELRRPSLWPPWWAAAWILLGVPITLIVVQRRAGDQTVPALVGVVLAGLMLAPVALWAYRRAQRRSPGRLQRIGIILSFAEAMAPAFDPAIRRRVVTYVARRRFNVPRNVVDAFDEAQRPAVEGVLSSWFAFVDTWSLSRRQAGYLALELASLILFLLLPPVVVLAWSAPELSPTGVKSSLVLYVSILALSVLGRGKRNSAGRWIRLVAVLALLEAMAVFVAVAWGAQNDDLQLAFATAILMAGGAVIVLATRWALLTVFPVRVRDWATVGPDVAVSGRVTLTAVYAALLAELAEVREPWSSPVVRRDLADRVVLTANWCERRLRNLCPSATDTRSAVSKGASDLRSLRPRILQMTDRDSYHQICADVKGLTIRTASGE